MEVVVVLGASKDSSRYSYQAIEMLKQFGHKPIPVNPKETSILGLSVFPHLEAISDQQIKIDTLTVYVNPAISTNLKNQILKLSPKRVIFNPGAENPDLEQVLKSNQIDVQNACTLVLLRTQQF